ncbi:MAG: glucokinase [Candidatus Electrothrix sp. AUS1_2]|nr:glucokinase [Candidatus Electrothrix sp. AUS1_2]
MTVLLSGDIGATKVDLQLVENRCDETSTGLSFSTLYTERYKCCDFQQFVDLAKLFFDTAKRELGEKYRHPEKACFAVAGPVADNDCHLTNLNWHFNGQSLQKELSIKKVSLINDFEAVGYGISSLDNSELETLQEGELQLGAPCAVIGAGTGLGEGFLMRQEDGSYRPYATEGSHADFAAHNEDEFFLRRYIGGKDDSHHVSVERVVSGPGIVTIYKFLRENKGKLVFSEEIEEIVRVWENADIQERQKLQDPAPKIAEAAIAENNPLCEETMRIFVKAYGAEAGNLALTILPYGGFYIAGGITMQIIKLIRAYGFIEAFNKKGRMRLLLEKIPVHVVKNNRVGVVGATVYALRS